MKFCAAAFCACCPFPPDSPRVPSAPPRKQLGGSVALTVRFLSGEPLVELSVGEHLRADELRAEVEEKASARLASEGCFVRALLWRTAKLEGWRTLWELGVRSGEHDVVAILDTAMEGDFERYMQGCSTCDGYTSVARMRFEPSGVAMLSVSYASRIQQERTFRYTLGEVEEGDHGWAEQPLRRSLRLQELTYDYDVCDAEAAGVFEGWLELDLADPIERRLCVEGLKVEGLNGLSGGPDGPRLSRPSTQLELEDLRALKRRGEDEAQMRVRILLQMSEDPLHEWQVSEREERSEELKYAAQVMVADTLTWAPNDAIGENGMYRNMFSRPRYESDRMLRDRCPKLRKPKHGRRRHCFWGMPCKGRRCHWICRRHGETRGDAARVRSATRRAERAFKAELAA